MAISNKEISAELFRQAANYPDYGEPGERAHFDFDGFKISCRANSIAISAMATKFGKGTKFKNPKPMRITMPRREPVQQLISRYVHDDMQLANDLRNHFDIQAGIL